MDNILKVLRIHGKSVGWFSVVSTLFLSVLLTACGGGGPGDEGVSSFLDSSTSKLSFSDALTNTGLDAGIQSESLCQVQNSLLCEDFEWSSSLDYRATGGDWASKGWQYNGLRSNGNMCNINNGDGSQCALTWMQSGNKDTINSKIRTQKASYMFAEYGAGENYIVVSWNARWSTNWRWDTKAIPFLSIDSLMSNKKLMPVVSIEIDANGVFQLVIKYDDTCGFKDKIIKAVSHSALLNNQLGRWHRFKLVFDAADASSRFALQLSLDNNIIVSTTVDELSCHGVLDTVNTSGVNAITFIANSRNQKINNPQSVVIDNILLRYK